MDGISYMIISFLILLILGVPIPIAMGIATAVGLY